MGLLNRLARRAGFATAVAAAVLLSAMDSGSAPAQSTRPQVAAAVSSGNAKLGVYDPAGTFGGASTLSIEHVYLPLIGVDLGSLRQAASYAASRNRDLMVTVEPWSWDGRWNVANDQSFADIVAGRRDKEIVSLCKAMDSLPTPVTIRWGHEMEAKTLRYAWTMLAPEVYISGYRHFVTLCRQYAPTAQFMWSPLGESGLDSYYPGDDVVDVIGYSVFALQPYEQDHFGRDRNVEEIARERYERLMKYRKPIYIAELGCEGDRSYVEECLTELRALGETLPALAGIVYFNDVEPVNWPGGYGRPDWRLPADAFAAGN